MTLTEKVRGDLGGTKFLIVEVSGLASGTNTISNDALHMNYISHSEWSHTIATLSATSTKLTPLLTVPSGQTLQIVALTGESGVLRVYGW